jgi:hypothetical protein
MSDGVFRGMHLKKNHFALCSKTNKTRKKSKISLFSLCFLSSFLFSLFSLFSRSVQGNGLISPRRYREKGSILGQKIENSWFSPKNTGDL